MNATVELPEFLKERRTKLIKVLDRIYTRSVNDDVRVLAAQINSVIRNPATEQTLPGVDPDQLEVWRTTVSLSEEDITKVSYMAWDQPDKRMRASFSKFIGMMQRKMGFRDTTDRELTLISEEFVKHIRAIDDDYEVEILDAGNGNIKRVYDLEYLGSCMHEKPYTRFYDTYVPNLRIIKLTRGGRYVGRALLWKTDDGHEFMDRVYPNNGRESTFLKGWARDQGIDYIETDTYCRPAASGRQHFVTTTLRVSHKDMDMLPYMDSFQFGCDHEGVLQLMTVPCNRDWDEYTPDGAEYRMNGTGGGYGLCGGDYETCPDCDERVSGDDTYEVYINRYNTRYVCEHCRDNDYLYDVQSGNYYHEDLWCYDDITGESILEWERVRLYDGRETHTDNAFRLATGELVAQQQLDDNEDNEFIQTATGRWYFRDYVRENLVIYFPHLYTCDRTDFMLERQEVWIGGWFIPFDELGLRALRDWWDDIPELVRHELIAIWGDPCVLTELLRVEDDALEAITSKHEWVSA